MIKLLRAEARRYFKNVLFWIGIAALLICGLYFGTLENLDVTYHLVVPIVMAVLISLIVGREYSDGGFRNKIISGHSKGKIFFAEWILSVILLVLYCSVYFSGMAITGAASFTDVPADVLLFSATAILVCTACFTFFFLFVSLTVSNKAVASVINLLLIVALSVPAYSAAVALMPRETYETYDVQIVDGESQIVPVRVKNPNYIGGTKRTVYTVIVKGSPFGQGIEQLQLLKYYKGEYYHQDNYNNKNYLEEEKNETDFDPVWALAVGGAITVAGYVLFRKKDIK